MATDEVYRIHWVDPGSDSTRAHLGSGIFSGGRSRARANDYTKTIQLNPHPSLTRQRGSSNRLSATLAISRTKSSRRIRSMKPCLFFTTGGKDTSTVFKDHVAVRNHNQNNESDVWCRFKRLVAGVATASKYGRHGVRPRSIGTIETGLETVADGLQVGDMPVVVETLADQHQASNVSANVATSGDRHQKRICDNSIGISDRKSARDTQNCRLHGGSDWLQESTGGEMERSRDIATSMASRRLRTE